MGFIKLSSVAEEEGLRNPGRETDCTGTAPAKRRGRWRSRSRFTITVRRIQRLIPGHSPGGIKRRTITHQIHRVPGKLSNYPKQCYNLLDQHLSELKKQLRELLEKGFIVHSQSPIAAPVFFVKKQDGTLRMVVDYRALNGIVIKYEYPLPIIHDMINRLGKARWFSKLDLHSGYHQVEVSETDQSKTAFRTRYGTFQFTVMPFSLAGAPSTFQRLMQNIFLEELDDFEMVYLDEVLVYSPTRRLHLHHLEKDFSKMRKKQLNVKLAKCEFCQQRVQYIGFVISSEGMAADPAKLKTLRDWPEI
ncbi:retrotransposon ty3-gypsy subclass [Cystoisospora suis]|uniref:Retrotransposon ty3-gypsy subclass n=1 Tax=Cystoisospora suis TaxID=483139 RepID=A0A2C6KGQ3_9APIC|nr:retrotransposon ty3-gypsy subclass [Cystoisospora suis]